jgi:hypothetical protein
MVDERIVYTLQTGEQVALPQGNPIQVGDRVLVHHTPDGKLATTGNNPIRVGDRVIVLTTNQGEKISVNVQDEIRNDGYIWAYLIPFGSKGKTYSFNDFNHSNHSGQDTPIGNIIVDIPPCKAMQFNMSYDVFTTNTCIVNVEYKLNGTNAEYPDPLLTGFCAFNTFFNEVTPQNLAFFENYYTIPVYPAESGTFFGDVSDSALEMPGGKLTVYVPGGTLEVQEQMQMWPWHWPPVWYYYFPPIAFHGTYSIKVWITKAEALANPDKYEIIP